MAEIDRVSMLQGWLMGRRIAGQRKVAGEAEKTPTGYLYNGVQLPELPVETADYSYLCIYKPNDRDYYCLWGSQSPIYIDTGNYGDKVNSVKPCVTFYSDSEGTDWGEPRFNIYGGGQILEHYIFIWCNSEIKKGNTVVHEGSDPVPVYE